MTQAERLACTEPGALLTWLRGRYSERKLWLLVCGSRRPHQVASQRGAAATRGRDFSDGEREQRRRRA